MNVVDASVSAADAVALVERDGYVIVENACEDELCDALVAEISRIERVHDVAPGANDFEGFHTRRIYNVLAKSPVFQRPPVHPNVLPIVEALLDPGLLLSGMTSIHIDPQETPQLLHADDGMVTLPRPHPATMITTLWALTDFTAENGATRFVPGSHRETAITPGPDYPSVAAEMPKGSVLILHASLWHGGGGNTSTQSRYGLSVQYVAGWCRQQQNLMLGLSPAVVAAFPTRLQELVGYAIYKNVMGHVDRQHPVTLLGVDRAVEMAWDNASPRRAP